MKRTPPTGPRLRRGTVLVIVVVLLLVAASIAAAVMRAALLDVRQFPIDCRAVQADRLAEAGLARARMRLDVDSDYDGETWQAELPDGETGTVVIQVAVEGDTHALEAVATYPDDGERAVRSRRRTTR